MKVGMEVASVQVGVGQRVRVGFQRCRVPKHFGLTFRCPKRDIKNWDILCLACEAEADGGETCGSYVHTVNTDGTYDQSREITAEEWASLPEISIDVYELLMGLARECQRFKQVKELLR